MFWKERGEDAGSSFFKVPSTQGESEGGEKNESPDCKRRGFTGLAVPTTSVYTFKLPRQRLGDEKGKRGRERKTTIYVVGKRKAPLQSLKSQACGGGGDPGEIRGITGRYASNGTMIIKEGGELQ